MEALPGHAGGEGLVTSLACRLPVADLLNITDLVYLVLPCVSVWRDMAW